MFLSIFVSLAIFAVTIFGLAWPVAARLTLDPVEKLCATVLLSLLALYLFAFLVFVTGLPPTVHHALPFGALAGLLYRRAELTATLRDPDARSLLTGQALVAAWCLGWLTFVTSYSGGSWAGDWLEHWQRTRFFLEHLPLETKFIGVHALPARPPLANLVTGAFLSATSVDFPHYQLFTTLLNSLAFLPAALLARRFGGAAAMAILTVLVMVSPFFAQNATFAWTKLIAAAWVLSGLYFFLRARDSDAPRSAAALCATALAASLLTHYSAGPYGLLLVIAWLAWPPRFRPTVWLISGVLLLTWFGWALANYGSATMLAHYAGPSFDPQPGRPVITSALNLRDTIVPPFLRSPDLDLIAQRSPWGYWRDWAFQLYQVNLLFIFGSTAWLVLAGQLIRRWRESAVSTRTFWGLFVTGCVVIGIVINRARDTWGYAHICLQPLAILGLSFLAAQWSRLSSLWRLAVIGGATLDFTLGIFLHFSIQGYLLDLWFTPGRSPVDVLTSYNVNALANFRAKLVSQLAFFADVFPATPALTLALLGAILAFALLRARQVLRAT